MKRREKEANARALASVLNRLLLPAYTSERFVQSRYFDSVDADIQQVRMTLWNISTHGTFSDSEREPLKRWFDPITYRRLFAMSSEVLWEGLPPVDYIAAIIAYQDHPQYKLLDLIKDRIEGAREYVGDKAAYSNEWRALAYLRSHPLVSTVRPKYVETLRVLLDESEYAELKVSLSPRDLLANQPAYKITPV